MIIAFIPLFSICTLLTDKRIKQRILRNLKDELFTEEIFRYWFMANDKYTFRIEKSDFTDKGNRNIRLYAQKDGTSHGLPLLSKRELNDLCNEIIDFLADPDNPIW